MCYRWCLADNCPGPHKTRRTHVRAHQTSRSEPHLLIESNGVSGCFSTLEVPFCTPGWSLGWKLGVPFRNPHPLDSAHIPNIPYIASYIGYIPWNIPMVNSNRPVFSVTNRYSCPKKNNPSLAGYVLTCSTWVNENLRALIFRQQKTQLFLQIPCLTGWTWLLWLSIQLGMSLSQLTFTPSFFRGVGIPTTNQIIITHH